MPSTTEMINYLKIQANGWNRTGTKGLLEVLDQAQNILYMQDGHQNYAVKSNGDLPVLSTTSGTYQYTLNQSATGLSDDIWRLEKVLVKPPFSNALLAAIRVEYGISPNLTQPVQQMRFNGVEYFEYYMVKSQDAKKNGHPTLTFMESDPGTSTDDFFMLCYKRPTTLSSELIQSSLPEQVHWTALVPAALALVEAYQNGNIREAMQLIKKEYMPEVQSEMNKGEQGVLHEITRIEE